MLDRCGRCDRSAGAETEPWSGRACLYLRPSRTDRIVNKNTAPSVQVNRSRKDEVQTKWPSLYSHLPYFTRMKRGR